MSTDNQNKTIYVVCGQTATGKSEHAVSLATQHNCAVLSTDSRQIYRGLDVGSNKISAGEMCSVPHYGLDIVEPMQRYTVSDYQNYARAIMLHQLEQNNAVVLCGGTGLYIDAVMFDHYVFGGKTATPEPSTWCYWSGFSDCDVVWIGLQSERSTLEQRIQYRAQTKCDAVVHEIDQLIQSGIDRNWMHGLGLEYTYGTELYELLIDRDQYIDLITLKTLQYAKRQKTWFKRNPNIDWSHIV